MSVIIKKRVELLREGTKYCYLQFRYQNDLRLAADLLTSFGLEMRATQGAGSSALRVKSDWEVIRAVLEVWFEVHEK